MVAGSLNMCPNVTAKPLASSVKNIVCAARSERMNISSISLYDPQINVYNKLNESSNWLSS